MFIPCKAKCILALHQTANVHDQTLQAFYFIRVKRAENKKVLSKIKNPTLLFPVLFDAESFSDGE